MRTERSHSAPPEEHRGFAHQAILYAGRDDLVDQAAPLLLAALANGARVGVAVTGAALDGLRQRLGEDARRVRWVDITGIGRNPARIIPLWREFVSHCREDGQARPLVGIGEPVYAGRTAAELIEAERHEALLNLAFGDTPDFDLYCPYDVGTLDGGAVDAARRTHPHLRRNGTAERSSRYRPDRLAEAFVPPLPRVGPSTQVPLEGRAPAEVHHFVVSQTAVPAENGIGPTLLSNLALATVAINAAVGGERLRTWSEDGHVVVEVSGRVPITDPLAGREWPAPAAEPGRGLWLANQLCDLVQWRNHDRGSVVRLQLS